MAITITTATTTPKTTKLTSVPNTMKLPPKIMDNKTKTKTKADPKMMTMKASSQISKNPSYKSLKTPFQTIPTNSESLHLS